MTTEAERALWRERHRARKAAETPEQREERRARERERMKAYRERRAAGIPVRVNQTDEERAAKKKAMLRDYHARRKATETPEQRNERRAKNREAVRRWSDANRDHKREYFRQRYATPEARRHQFAKYLKYEYGMTLEQWEDMFEAQGFVCALCEATPERPVTDHCHETGKVRGILCHQCNVSIHRGRPPEYFERIAAYLRR